MITKRDSAKLVHRSAKIFSGKSFTVKVDDFRSFAQPFMKIRVENANILQPYSHLINLQVKQKELAVFIQNGCLLISVIVYPTTMQRLEIKYVNYYLRYKLHNL